MMMGSEGKMEKEKGEPTSPAMINDFLSSPPETHGHISHKINSCSVIRNNVGGPP